ncbi:cytosolic protein [Bradyrhizobium sp. WSM2254]|uniref:cytosolic protein n=1 Tax=Bradyrhizobium sp. WSM2254 TaxID=1188263 RepID=UPI001FD8AD0A|nr:cytosolic protein [Bradyrhizobium sp. WSM2254]
MPGEDQVGRGAKEDPMKSLLLLTASGPLLVLTSHQSLNDQKLLGMLRQKGIGKFVAFDVPLSLARERYGGHFHAVESNLHETDDLRVLDFNGQRVFQLFHFEELGSPMLIEQS